MIRIFMTGDNHFGLKFDKWECRETLLQSRFDSFSEMVTEAESSRCDLFVVTGDLFENTYSIRVQDVKKIADILKRFSGRVLILPGNHDFYSGDEKVWKDFENAADTVNNIFVLKEAKPLTLDVGEEKITVWPAPCGSKHSKVNNIGWIRNEMIDESVYNIGIAHGAVAGRTIGEGEYFPMAESELRAVPVDAWLLGHTHVPFPQLSEKDEAGHKIFNAGTHEQPDRATNTAGYGFILTLKRENGQKAVYARSWQSGRIHFINLDCAVKPGEHLEEALDRALDTIPEMKGKTLLHLELSGGVPPEEYDSRESLYAKKRAAFLDLRVRDEKLAPLITREKIRSEYPEINLAARLLEELLGNPKEAQMAYELLKSEGRKGAAV